MAWFRPALRVTFGMVLASDPTAASAPAADRLPRPEPLSKPRVCYNLSHIGRISAIKYEERLPANSEDLRPASNDGPKLPCAWSSHLELRDDSLLKQDDRFGKKTSLARCGKMPVCHRLGTPVSPPRPEHGAPSVL